MNTPRPRRFQFGLRALLLAFVPVAVAALLVGIYLRQPRPVRVTGIARLNGKPLYGARITFFPTNVNKHVADAMTDVTGGFNMATSLGGASYIAGVLPGSYQIALVRFMAPPTNQIPKRYADPATSGLTAEVTKDGPNRFTFNLVTE